MVDNEGFSKVMSALESVVNKPDFVFCTSGHYVALHDNYHNLKKSLQNLSHRYSLLSDMLNAFEYGKNFRKGSVQVVNYPLDIIYDNDKKFVPLFKFVIHHEKDIKNPYDVAFYITAKGSPVNDPVVVHFSTDSPAPTEKFPFPSLFAQIKK